MLAVVDVSHHSYFQHYGIHAGSVDLSVCLRLVLRVEARVRVRRLVLLSTGKQGTVRDTKQRHAGRHTDNTWQHTKREGTNVTRTVPGLVKAVVQHHRSGKDTYLLFSGRPRGQGMWYSSHLSSHDLHGGFHLSRNLPNTRTRTDTTTAELFNQGGIMNAAP